MIQKLIFVYNADSGYWNMWLDIAHKVFSPDTYPCSLCDLTYGVMKIEPEWDTFVQNAPVPFEFLHKDEYLAVYPNTPFRQFPFILQSLENGSQQMFIPAEVLNGFTHIDALKRAILEGIT
jgi:hypothetical protein